ncbi:uncharacterized protein LOC121875250, partial [Homarus americanus]|uniref:uncharacterized protein LOC121875250 n=1 Tax=Homarus americanus TaxID=6706 RepID=UPI001C485209
ERLLLALYSHYPSTVRKVLPPQDDIARKNVLYRNLFEQLEALDEKREAATPRSRGSPPRASVPSAVTITTTPTHHSSCNSSSSSGVSTGGSSVGSRSGSMGCGAVPQISITPDEAQVRGRALSRLNGSRLDLSSMDGDLSPSDPEDKTCIFCGAFDKTFTDSGLDFTGRLVPC